MARNRMFTMALVLGCMTAGGLLTSLAVSSADAGYVRYRQHYSGWSYHPRRSYYYSRYYYKPVAKAPSYNYHYSIYYPSRPRYVYYYNPHKSCYWGRLDLEGEEGKQYSILKEEDRKAKLEDIPESAFPAPAEMPVIPDATDGERMAPPASVPTDEAELPESAGDAPGAQ